MNDPTAARVREDLTVWLQRPICGKWMGYTWCNLAPDHDGKCRHDLRLGYRDAGELFDEGFIKFETFTLS